MSNEDEKDSPKYTAPALEKGLDIVEFLARTTEPKTVNEIAQGLARSRGEIFRMLSVLERRGIIQKTRNGDTFEITDKLFSLRQQRSFATQATAIAIPKMEDFCQITGQSCHLALRTKAEIIVILRVEHPENLNMSVPVGHRRAIYDSPSGLCILAFSDSATVDAVLQHGSRKLSKDEQKTIRDRIAQIASAGYAAIEESFVFGVNGISAPIVDTVTGRCNMALTTTMLHEVSKSSADQATIIQELTRCAAEISEQYSA
jgi:DNA-binding IclR family transcriptional regulator